MLKILDKNNIPDDKKRGILYVYRYASIETLKNAFDSEHESVLIDLSDIGIYKVFLILYVSTFYSLTKTIMLLLSSDHRYLKKCISMLSDFMVTAKNKKRAFRRQRAE